MRWCEAFRFHHSHYIAKFGKIFIFRPHNPTPALMGGELGKEESTFGKGWLNHILPLNNIPLSSTHQYYGLMPHTQYTVFYTVSQKNKTPNSCP